MTTDHVCNLEPCVVVKLNGDIYEGWFCHQCERRNARTVHVYDTWSEAHTAWKALVGHLQPDSTFYESA